MLRHPCLPHLSRYDSCSFPVNLQACLQLLLDHFTVVGMCALLPLLESIDTLVNFAQKRDVYICDFVAAVKVCQADLYWMYADKGTAYVTDEF